MNRLLVLFVVGLVFGAVARVLHLNGLLGDNAPGATYVSALGFGVGVVAALAAIMFANYFSEHETELHPHH